MPNRPDDGDEEVEPVQQFVKAERQPQLSGDGVEADGGQRKSDHHGRNGLEGRLLAQSDETAERQKIDREFLRRTKSQREACDQRRTSVIMATANSAPTNDEVNAAVNASPALPFCAIG
jgi:hypothetical protein